MSNHDAGERGKDLAAALSRALQALAEHDLERAAGLAESLSERLPQDGSVRQLRAAVALSQNRPEEAERWALSSLERRPGHYATLMIAAAAAQLRGDWTVAHERFTRAAEIEPDRPQAAFGAGLTAIALDGSAAEDAVERLRRRFPGPSQAWGEIGAACERAGRRDLAAEAYATALEAQPSARLYLRLGAALASLGRRGEAASAFQNALTLDPASAEGWFKLGLCFQDGRLPQLAENAYRQALSLRPDLAEAEANLGVVLQSQGDLEAAKQAYGRAINLMPSAFGRIAQALTTEPKGELWLDLGALRGHLSELGRLSR